MTKGSNDIDEQPAKEVSLAEIMQLVWKKKIYALVGLLVGTTLAYLLAIAFTKPWYLSKFTLSIDANSLPAITNPGKLLPSYSSCLASPEVAVSFFTGLEGIAPEFKNGIASSSFNIQDLTFAQSVSDADDEIPVRLLGTRSASDYFLITRLPVKGMSSAPKEKIVNLLNSLAIMCNRRVLDFHLNEVAVESKDARENFEAVSKKHEEAKKRFFSERQDLSEKMATIEYKLLKSLNSSQSTFLKVRSETKVEVGQQLCIEHALTKCPTAQDLDFERTYTNSLRLLAALKQEGRIDSKVLKAFQDELITIKVDRSKAESDYFLEIKPIDNALRALLASAANRDKILDKTETFLPLFVETNSAAIGQVSLDLRSSRSIKFSIAVGGVLGLLGGVLVGIYGRIKKLRLTTFLI